MLREAKHQSETDPAMLTLALENSVPSACNKDGSKQAVRRAKKGNTDCYSVEFQCE